MGYLADNETAKLSARVLCHIVTLNGPSSEYRQQDAILIAFEADVFAETSDVGISESLAIQVVEEVGCTAKHLVKTVRHHE